MGGFEEAFRAYGGEDWELAHRCWLRGADFVHARDAVAWHDGPDFAGRTGDADALRSRNVEGLALARFVPGTATRGSGLVWAHPDVVVRLDDTAASDAQVVESVRSLLAGSDCGVWLRTGSALDVLDDPRVHRGEPPAAVLARCRFRVELDRPVVLTGATLQELADVAPVRVGEHLAVRRTRDVHRGRGRGAGPRGARGHRDGARGRRPAALVGAGGPPPHGAPRAVARITGRSGRSTGHSGRSRSSLGRMGGYRQQAEDQILDRAAALLARRGAQTSVQEIADAVGLSKAGLLHHFPSKDSLHSAVLARAAGIGEQVLEVVDGLPIGPERDLRAIEALIDVALAHPGLVSLLLTPVSTATGDPTDGGAEAIQASAAAALAAFGVDPETATAERTVRVSARSPPSAC